MSYVNMNKPLKNGGRKTTDGSMKSLVSALFKALKKIADEEEYEFVTTESEMVEHFRYDWDDEHGSILFDLLTNLFYSNSQLNKDITKINFDLENMSYDANEDMGLETLPNGLSVLKILAGGDWEFPIFFVVYFDGKKLRAYIPERGNCYNSNTKEAIGNDEELDEEFIQKQGVKDLDEVEVNFEECLKDVMSRIELV